MDFKATSVGRMPLVGSVYKDSIGYWKVLDISNNNETVDHQINILLLICHLSNIEISRRIGILEYYIGVIKGKRAKR